MSSKKTFKVLFMGTPEFCVPTLKALVADPHIELPLVITQPDSPKGRKLELKPTPVKKFCIDNDIAVETPLKVSSPDWIEKLSSYDFDAVVVLAYGQILKQDLLDINPNNFLNIHASLLPRWRGAAPIQRAIMEGDKETGVSFQVMKLKLDSGPVVFEKKIKIKVAENSIELAERLSNLSGEVVCDVLKSHLNGETVLKIQDENNVTYAHKLLKSEGLLDFNQEAEDLHNKIRGLQWGPGAYTLFKGKRLKLSDTRFSLEKELSPGEVGELLNDEQLLWIGTAKGALGVQTVQPEGKPKMKVSDFVNGYGLTQEFNFLQS